MKNFFKRYGLPLFFGALVIAACVILVLTAGNNPLCNNFYDYKNTTSPESEIEGVEAVLETLPDIKHPEIVEECARVDKTLINPMASLSTSAFSTIKVLGENKYFQYENLKTEDIEALDKLTEPTNVSVTLYRDPEYTDWAVQFSCFIYKIDDDYIYLGTAGHCIVKNSNVKRAKVMFYDRTEITTSLEEYQLGNTFRSRDGDYAMYRIPTSAVDYELLLRLKEVSYSKASILKVNTGDKLYSGNIYARDKQKDYDKELVVLDKASESYIASSFYSSDAYFVTDVGLVAGQSGSAVFDMKGHLVAICSGGTNGYKNNVGIFTVADKIVDLYDIFQENDMEAELAG